MPDYDQLPSWAQICPQVQRSGPPKTDYEIVAVSWFT